MPPAPRSSTNRAIRSRDRGLRTVSVVTRGLVAGSVGVAGLFSAMAAWAQPGHAKTTPTGTAVGQTRGTFTPPATQPPATTPTTPAAGDDGGSVTPATQPAVTPVAPLAPPTTLPAPVYQYTPPAPVYQYNPPQVVSGAS